MSAERGEAQNRTQVTGFSGPEEALMGAPNAGENALGG